MIDRKRGVTIHCDLNLARRLETVEAEGGGEYAAAHARLFPDGSATSIGIGSGRAIFAGVDSPVTQAFALGLNGEVAAAELEELEGFFRSHGARANIEVCPLADTSLTQRLYERGYCPIEQTNVLVRALPAGDAMFEHHSREVKVREATHGEEQVWAEIVSRGFAETDEALAMMLDLSRTAFHVTSNHCFIAEIDGAVVAGGSMALRNGIAALSGASTLTEFRKRGAQTSLLWYRLQYAAERGCDLATVTTLPGSTSQRNAERNNFQVAYTRTKWMLDVTLNVSST